MKKRKISVTTGTRAEYGILRPILDEIKNSRKLQLILIVTGSHLSKKHGLTLNEIKKDGYKIAGKINIVPKNSSEFETTKSIGNGIILFAKIACIVSLTRAPSSDFAYVIISDGVESLIA